jgi:vitamin B12 transporter
MSCSFAHARASLPVCSKLSGSGIDLNRCGVGGRFRAAIWLAAAAALVPQPASAQSAASTVTSLPVVVSAAREPIPAADVGSTVTVITGEELEERQIRIVSDALRAVPGASP